MCTLSNKPQMYIRSCQTVFQSSNLKHQIMQTLSSSSCIGTVPDHPTAGRWCKNCRTFLPLENFPLGRRSYQCKLHTWPIAKARRDKCFSLQPQKLGLWRMWHYAYLDSKAVFLCSGWSLMQDDIQKLCDKTAVMPSNQLRVVPLNPRSPLTTGNIAVVSRLGRTLLVKIWKVSKDVDMYVSALKLQQLTIGE